MSTSDIIGILGIVISLIIFCLPTNLSAGIKVVIAIVILLASLCLVIIPRANSETRSGSSQVPEEETNDETIADTTEDNKTITIINDQFSFLGDRPSANDLNYLEKNTGTVISRPSTSELLDSYELRYVRSEHGNAIRYFWAPTATNDYILKRRIYDDTPLIVLGRRKSMICVTFIIDGEYKYGWVSEQLTTAEEPSNSW